MLSLSPDRYRVPDQHWICTHRQARPDAAEWGVGPSTASRVGAAPAAASPNLAWDQTVSASADVRRAL